jgi:hypothetical protein
MRYPYPCVRCGFCCMSEICLIGQRVYGLFEKGARCPGLRFGNKIAFCALVKFNLVPIGDGCCMAARVFRDGVEYDFAALPGEIKRELTQMIVNGVHSEVDLQKCEGS